MLRFHVHALHTYGNTRCFPPAEPPPEAPSAAAAPAEFAEEAEAGEPSLFDADVRPFRPKPGVYARGMHAREMAAQQAARLTGTARWVFKY